VVTGDAAISRDLNALRGRLAGWRSARHLPRRDASADAIDASITFWESLRLRRIAYSM